MKRACVIALTLCGAALLLRGQSQQPLPQTPPATLQRPSMTDDEAVAA